jgi:hypothetical protein
MTIDLQFLGPLVRSVCFIRAGESRSLNWHGLLVSRLSRVDHPDALVSDQRECDSVSMGAKSSWRIVGKVLWWTGRAR